MRYIKRDDIWLSPFNGRETGSIAVHRYHQEDYHAMFAAIEPIMQKYDGRPHWGKLNTMNHIQFSQHYTHWNDFKAVRQQLDPKGQFLNPYLASLFNNN